MLYHHCTPLLTQTTKKYIHSVYQVVVGMDKMGPKTIAEMRKEEMAKEMDPEKLKVSDILVYALIIIQRVCPSQHVGGCLKLCP